MKILTYIRTSEIQATRLMFSTPEPDQIFLETGLPVPCKAKTFDWLKTNNQEFQLCLEQKIILAEPAPKTTTSEP